MTRYPITVADNVQRWCPSCDDYRPIYLMETDTESLAGCTRCSRVITRGKTADAVRYHLGLMT